MGKKRITIMGEQPIKKEQKTEESGRKLARSGKEHGRITDMGAQALAEAERIQQKEKELEKEAHKEKGPKAKKVSRLRKRGARYLEALKKIDRNRHWSPSEAIKILKSVSLVRFNGSVDAHLNVSEVGLKGEVKFPHPTGKSQTVRIADDQLITELEQRKINFTTLIATPAMMPKILKFAKLLGPRGLMPNPKAGTITDKPEKLMEQFSGKVSFRTEAKSPIIHMPFGRVDSSEKDLEENFRALIRAVGTKNILKVVIAPTMGPGIKVDIQSLSQRFS